MHWVKENTTQESAVLIHAVLLSYSFEAFTEKAIAMSENKKVIGYEFKHASWVPSMRNDEDECVFVKELIHYNDGTTKPNIRAFKNFEKSFYITRDTQRTHKEKKPWEHIDNLREYRSTQRKMPQAIGKALGYGSGGLKMMNRSPYVYGSDISTTSIIKHNYRTKYKDLHTPYTVAHLDIETDMTGRSNNDIIMISVVIGTKCYQVVTKLCMGTNPNFLADVRKLFEQEIPNAMTDVWSRKFFDEKKNKYTVDPFEYELIQEIAEDEADAVCKTFDWIHKEMPDYLSIVNVPFDMGKMARALERRDINPADVFCDPRVPREYRKYRLVEGASRIEDANGKGAAIPPHQRWHKVYCAASYMVVDQICTRWGIRKHKPNEGKYGLDAVLQRVLGIGKLKGDGLVRSSGADWHRLMQREHMAFYAVYNCFDNIGASWHDMYTKDMSHTLDNIIGMSDITSYGSEGRKLYDDQYYKYLKKGKVVCGISDKMEHELDQFLITLDGWISTLSPTMIHDEMRNALIKGKPNMLTMIILFVLDIDVKSSYPSTGVWANLENLNIIRQMCKIHGLDTLATQRAGLDLTAGRVNAIDILNKVCRYPLPQAMLHRLAKHENIKLTYELPAIADQYCEQEYRTFDRKRDSGGRSIQLKFTDEEFHD